MKLLSIFGKKDLIVPWKKKLFEKYGLEILLDTKDIGYLNATSAMERCWIEKILKVLKRIDTAFVDPRQEGEKTIRRLIRMSVYNDMKKLFFFIEKSASNKVMDIEIFVELKVLLLGCKQDSSAAFFHLVKVLEDFNPSLFRRDKALFSVLLNVPTEVLFLNTLSELIALSSSLIRSKDDESDIIASILQLNDIEVITLIYKSVKLLSTKDLIVLQESDYLSSKVSFGSMINPSTHSMVLVKHDVIQALHRCNLLSKENTKNFLRAAFTVLNTTNSLEETKALLQKIITLSLSKGLTQSRLNQILSALHQQAEAEGIWEVKHIALGR